MSTHYKIVQEEKVKMYKIHITTKIFGITIWTSFYCQQTSAGCYDMSWVGKQDAIDYMDSLSYEPKYKDIGDS